MCRYMEAAIDRQLFQKVTLPITSGFVPRLPVVGRAVHKSERQKPVNIRRHSRARFCQLRVTRSGSGCACCCELFSCDALAVDLDHVERSDRFLENWENWEERIRKKKGIQNHFFSAKFFEKKSLISDKSHLFSKRRSERSNEMADRNETDRYL